MSGDRWCRAAQLFTAVVAAVLIGLPGGSASLTWRQMWAGLAFALLVCIMWSCERRATEP
jgi:hypothetical protein